MRMVFIDEKTIYACPCTSVKVICPRGTELTIGEDWRLLKGGKRSVVVVKGIFAVNAVIGPVLWRPLSGTDGYDTPYKVRLSGPAPLWFQNSHCHAWTCFTAHHVKDAYNLG
jgi:hypothetical protein